MKLLIWVILIGLIFVSASSLLLVSASTLTTDNLKNNVQVQNASFDLNNPGDREIAFDERGVTPKNFDVF